MTDGIKSGPTHQKFYGSIQGRRLAFYMTGEEDGNLIYKAHSLLSGTIIIKIPKDFGYLSVSS